MSDICYLMDHYGDKSLVFYKCMCLQSKNNDLVTGFVVLKQTVYSDGPVFSLG